MNTPSPQGGEQYFNCRASELEKLGRLGAGASGTVYKARHVPSNTLVALKQINAMDSETRKQILNEMRTLCDNPNAPGLVKFYGAYYVADSAQMCIALEYMNGGSLEDFAKVLPVRERERESARVCIFYFLSARDRVRKRYLSPSTCSNEDSQKAQKKNVSCVSAVTPSRVTRVLWPSVHVFNVCRPIRVVCFGGGAFIVRYAPGNKLPEQALSIIVGRVLVGLDYLHRVRYMIHRQGEEEEVSTRRVMCHVQCVCHWNVCVFSLRLRFDADDFGSNQRTCRLEDKWLGFTGVAGR